MTDDIISPLYDFAFAQIFGNPRNLGSTRAFLKTMLDIPEDDYDRLTVMDPGLHRFFQNDKKGVVDLKLTTKSGRIIHIELQVEKMSNLRSRAVFYTARLLGDQLDQGDDFDNLQQVISIWICDHVLLEEEDAYFNVYELMNRKNNRFTDLLKLVILELPKLPAEADSPLWPWLRFFKCTKKEEIEMLARKHPELSEAVSTVRKVSFGERWRWRRFLNQMDKWQKAQDRKEARVEGRAEGHAEGCAEGRAEEALAIAQKMKTMGFPDSQITEITGLGPGELRQN